MSEPAVIIDNVSKKFRRGERHDSLRDLVPAIARRLTKRVPRDLAPNEFWAVRDVSFEVRPGEAVAIIGPNGAGKSTLLKLLTRILKPTHGRCEMHGRVGALIEVAAGFHPDLTGRENVYLQGAIMGMKRTEISTKFDAIVDFSGVREFIDTPVKRYSSGMNARLGFAIAAHLDPDVLLIDEVLAVGDVTFQEQCIARMRELTRRGIPLIFISHNLPAVLELCSRAIVLDHGRIQFDGAPTDAIRAYRQPEADRQAAAPGKGPVWITGGELVDGFGDPAAVFETGGTLSIRLRYNTAGPVPRPHFAVDIHRADGIYCAGINTQMDNINGGTLNGAGSLLLTVRNLPLLPGSYSVSLGVLDPTLMTPIDLRMHAHYFSVTSEQRGFGLVALERNWRDDGRSVTGQPTAAPGHAARPSLVVG